MLVMLVHTSAAGVSVVAAVDSVCMAGLGVLRLRGGLCKSCVCEHGVCVA